MQVSGVDNQPSFSSRYAYRKMAKSPALDLSSRQTNQLSKSSAIIKRYENMLSQKNAIKEQEMKLIAQEIEQMEQQMKDLVIHLDSLSMERTITLKRGQNAIIVIGKIENKTDIVETLRRCVERLGITIVPR